MKEKLIDCINGVLKYLPWGEITPHTAEDIAERLIENGATIPVRCKECKYGVIDDDFPDEDFPIQYLCKHHVVGWNDGEHFCAYGERRTNE